MGLLASLSLVGTTPGNGASQSTAYLDHASLTRELRSLAGGSDLVRLESIGQTLEGRDLWVLAVGNPDGAPFADRPGILVVGNLEGSHLVGSALALDAVRYLLENAETPEVRRALDTQVFYVVPRLNPDGAEARFASVTSHLRTNRRPFDDDNDGRVDEDPPQDLNGDGFLTVMRVAEPGGAYILDPADPRVLKKADPTKGEVGAYALYTEGLDDDGDGFLNEDGPGGVDLNRNFQHAYPYWERDAGPYMVSEVESRALMDFVLAHRNISAILTFGESDNLVTPPDARGALAAARVLDLPRLAEEANNEVFEVGVFTSTPGGARGGGFGRGGGGGFLRGALPGRDNDPGSGQRPATTVATRDLPYFQAVSDRYRSITGIESVPVHRTPEGAFFQFGYFQFGVPSFSTPGWGLPASEGAPARGGGATGDAALLKALEDAQVDAFAPWEAFEHPTLGPVEIGGFHPYVTTNPPPTELAAWGAKQGEFLVALAGMLPRVTLAEATATANGSGVYTVEVVVENTGFFPTSTQHGVTSRTVGPTQVQIQVDADRILTGADKTVNVGRLDGSGSRQRYSWVIQGRSGEQIEVRLRSQKSGSDVATVTLR